MKEQKSFYGVLIWNRAVPEKAFLGHSGSFDLPQLYAKRKDAVAYKKACLDHGIDCAKVVRVAITLEYEMPEGVANG